jgi:hypothetical protein
MVFGHIHHLQLCENADDFMPLAQVHYKCSSTMDVNQSHVSAEECVSRGCYMQNAHFKLCQDSAAVSACADEVGPSNIDQVGVASESCFQHLALYIGDHPECMFVDSKNDVTPLCKMALGFPCGVPACSCSHKVETEASCTSLLPGATCVMPGAVYKHSFLTIIDDKVFRSIGVSKQQCFETKHES